MFVLALTACSGASHPKPRPSATAPSPIALDWRTVDAKPSLPGGWSIFGCPGPAPTFCVEQNGVKAGSIQLMDIPSLGEEKTTSQEQIQAVLAGRIQTLYRDTAAKRSEDCGLGFRLVPASPRPVMVAGQRGVKYGFAGSDAGGVRETLTGFRIFRQGIESIIQAVGINPGGCPAAQDGAFTPAGLTSFEPLLDRLVAGSLLPTPTKFVPVPSPSDTPEPPRQSPPPSIKPGPAPSRSAAQGNVAGIAVAGPVCPVAKIPPDPRCDPRPVPGARLQVTDGAGRPVARTTTDETGRFAFTLPPGRYRLVPQPVQGLLGTPGSTELTVPSPGELTVRYDTGIR